MVVDGEWSAGCTEEAGAVVIAGGSTAGEADVVCFIKGEAADVRETEELVEKVVDPGLPSPPLRELEPEPEPELPVIELVAAGFAGGASPASVLTPVVSGLERGA